MPDFWGAEGSRLRDRWRYLHKKRLGHGKWYGADGDFFIIDFEGATPIAYIDIKGLEDDFTETELILYGWFMSHGLGVYVSRVIDVETGTQTLYRLRTLEGETILESLCNDWDDYRRWEAGIRSATYRPRWGTHPEAMPPAAGAS